jgi:hypothetical protein
MGQTVSWLGSLVLDTGWKLYLPLARHEFVLIRRIIWKGAT